MKEIEGMLEQEIYQFADKIKELLSPQIWENVLLDCSKNEILILWLLYRRNVVNMSQIADYIHVPLNTATGIIARMEKRCLVIRQRNEEDKRVVTIQLGQQGTAQLQALLKEIMYYVGKVTAAFSEEEMSLFYRMMDKVMQIMMQIKQEEQTGQKEEKKVKKILIE